MTSENGCNPLPSVTTSTSSVTTSVTITGSDNRDGSSSGSSAPSVRISGSGAVVRARGSAGGRLLCGECGEKRAMVKRPKTGQQVCKDCFFLLFESEIHRTIVENKLFKRGEKVAVAASGGKDSTVLAHIMSLLNARHDYGLQLFLLSIDEGITGYRDDSLETVKRNEKQYGIPLTILSYKDLYGWTMDEIVASIGRKNNCTFCGVFRRQALDRGAALLSADKLVTGHNADDFAETVLLNLLRGDVARLSRCPAITTGEDSALPRSKPFKYTYEKEIVIYPPHSSQNPLTASLHTTRKQAIHMHLRERDRHISTPDLKSSDCLAYSTLMRICLRLLKGCALFLLCLFIQQVRRVLPLSEFPFDAEFLNSSPPVCSTPALPSPLLPSPLLLFSSFTFHALFNASFAAF
ncbi:hypothetical protein CLOM_g18846 [Closterium sp. NIES-68]|nr:hypothetical protein CLOM_g18846 [Closterium sp. NIES-68]GJP57446.1 hypothetical protein CLOP_g45 [Closterium sp. NIES-67]GJP87019.1 hypothetical protein CLOP_g16986 [Closterium sp. NIES-67]